MSAETDAQLIERMRRGEVEAFEVIVNRHRAALVALATYRLRSHADAEDVAQEAFVQAFFHLHELRDPAALLPWLRQVTARLALMRVRGDREEPMAPERLENVCDLDEVTAFADAEAAGLLETLPPDMRETVSLTYLDGYTCAEAAEMLGVRAGTVKSRLSRARAKLKEALAMPEMEKAEPGDDFTRRTIERLKKEARRLLAAGDLTAAAQRAQAVLAEQVKPVFGDPKERGVAGTLLTAWDTGAVEPDPEAVAMAGLDWKAQRHRECEANAAQYGFRLADLDWKLEGVSYMSETVGRASGHGEDVWGVPVSRMKLTIIDARALCQRLRCSPVDLDGWVRRGCPILRCRPWARFDLDRVQQWLQDNGMTEWARESAYFLERPLRVIFREVYRGTLAPDEGERIMADLGEGAWDAPTRFTGGWNDGCA